jgi:hypothetical protein
MLSAMTMDSVCSLERSHNSDVHGRKHATLKRQLTLADDECHPPPALLVKTKEADTLIQAETSEIGQVKLTVFLTYMRAIGLPVAIAFLFFYILSTGAAVGSNFWLSAWSNDPLPINGTVDTDLRDLRLGIYGLLGLTQGQT